MNVRSFEWRDLSLLHRYRDECIYLNSSLVLTRGPLFVPTGAILSTFASATGLFTYLYEAEEDSEPFLGQVSHYSGLPSAQLTFFAPKAGLQSDSVTSLVEQMLEIIGRRGGLHLLAEAEEQTEAVGVLRQAGFGIYTRQNIWQLAGKRSSNSQPPTEWRSARKQDEAGIRFLYANLVPGLVQQVETLPSGRLHGLVYYRGTEMLAYVDLEYGLSGIMAHPFIHPDADAVAEALINLLYRLPDLYARPIYLRIRSYQSWLDGVLGSYEAEQISQQAVMVRHLAVTQRALQNRTVPVLNGSTPEPTIPVTRIETK